MRGAQGSRSSLCVLLGPLISIVAGVWRMVVSCSMSSSEAVSSLAGSSVCASSATSVVWTSSLIGPR